MSDGTRNARSLSRREFLILAGSAGAGAALASCAPAPTPAPPTAVPPTAAPTVVPSATAALKYTVRTNVEGATNPEFDEMPQLWAKTHRAVREEWRQFRADLDRHWRRRRDAGHSTAAHREDRLYRNPFPRRFRADRGRSSAGGPGRNSDRRDLRLLAGDHDGHQDLPGLDRQEVRHLVGRRPARWHRPLRVRQEQPSPGQDHLRSTRRFFGANPGSGGRPGRCGSGPASVCS